MNPAVLQMWCISTKQVNKLKQLCVFTPLAVHFFNEINQIFLDKKNSCCIVDGHNDLISVFQGPQC